MLFSSQDHRREFRAWETGRNDMITKQCWLQLNLITAIIIYSVMNIDNEAEMKTGDKAAFGLIYG